MGAVTVIGCGNIGSRLLQSVSNIQDPQIGRLDVFGVEPNEAAHALAAQRFDEENAGGHALHMLRDCAPLPDESDLLIVAVDARNRLAALEAALEATKPKAIVLEKVLFTAPADFERAATLIDQVGAPTWVNCTRNVWPGYQDLKARFGDKTHIEEFKVSGSDWNLGSNAIHFLAAYEYLSGAKVADITLDPDAVEVRDAKRAGYKEIVGALEARSESGARIVVESYATPDKPIRIEITTDNDRFVISEAERLIENTAASETADFAMYFASQIHHVFENIMLGRGCDLPAYAESARLHLTLFKALNKAFHPDGDGAQECPVT